MRPGNGSGSTGVKILLGDHLGSTSKTTDYLGTTVTSTTLYKPWGATRYTNGTLPTKYTYTGQYSYTTDFGLMYYGARWYDPALGRWTQPDTIIPESSQGTQAWDRMGYVNNNPITYNDPNGHWMCGDLYDPGCAENALETAQYLKATSQLSTPKVLNSWEDIKDDPAELMARAILSEEGIKLQTNEKMSDAEGAAWVLRNRYEKWYASGDRPEYSQWGEDNYWLKATTSGVFGMGSGEKKS